MSKTESEKEFPPELFTEENVDGLFKSVTDDVAQGMNGGIIHNHNTVDAWYLFRKILAFAEQEQLPVTIVSGTMRKDFYNCLTQELEALLKKRVSVRAYLTELVPEEVVGRSESEKAPSERNRFAEQLAKAAHENPESYALVGARMKNADEIPHAIYAGENGVAFRLEKDPRTHAALGSFGPSENPLGKIVVGMMTPCIKSLEKAASKSVA